MFGSGDSGVRVVTFFEKLVTVVMSPILTANVKCSHCVPIFQKGNGKAIKNHLNNYESAIIFMFHLTCFELHQILSALLYQEAITDPLIFFFSGVG